VLWVGREGRRKTLRVGEIFKGGRKRTGTLQLGLRRATMSIFFFERAGLPRSERGRETSEGSQNIAARGDFSNGFPKRGSGKRGRPLLSSGRWDGDG